MASSIIPKSSLPFERVTGLTASNSYASATCNYAKYGNVVMASFTVTALSNIGQSTGQLSFSGLPRCPVDATGAMRTLAAGDERGTYNGVALLSNTSLSCFGPKTKDVSYSVSITYLTE